MRIFCSICKDIYIHCSEVHVTNCGHLYHGACISTWIKQHRTCPQCRANLSKTPFRVYFDVDKDNDADPSTLEHQIETLSDKLRDTERDKKNLLEEKKSFEKIVKGLQGCAMSLSEKNDFLKSSVKALKEQVTKLSMQNKAVTHLESELEEMKNKLSTLTRVETVIKGSVEEVNKLIESTPVTGVAVKHLCTYVGILKSQLQKIETKNIALVKETRALTKALAEEKQKNSNEAEEVIKNLKEKNNKLENELLSLKMLHKNYKKKVLMNKQDTISPPETNSTQVEKPPSYNLTLDIFNDEEVKNCVHASRRVETDKTINNWEEIVCAGPSINIGLSVMKSRSFSKTSFFKKGDEESSRSNAGYAYDGMGGRKKLRLGSPTPAEEFGLIQKKKGKKPAPSFQHKKIIDYCTLE